METSVVCFEDDIKIEKYCKDPEEWVLADYQRPNSRVVIWDTEEDAKEHAVAICAQRAAERAAKIFRTKIQKWAVEITPVPVDNG